LIDWHVAENCVADLFLFYQVFELDKLLWTVDLACLVIHRILGLKVVLLNLLLISNLSFSQWFLAFVSLFIVHYLDFSQSSNPLILTCFLCNSNTCSLRSILFFSHERKENQISDHLFVWFLEENLTSVVNLGQVFLLV